MANITPRLNKKGEVISYRILVYRGRDSNGKQLKPYTATFKPELSWSESKNQKALQNFAMNFEEKCKGGNVVDTKQTFQKYSEYVIDLKARIEKRKHRTIKRYNELLERINPAIGHIKLSELRPQHLNTFYNMLGQDGANLKTGGLLSSKTIIEHHRLIRTILNQAEKEMLIEYNAAARATPPIYKKKEANFLEIEDISNVLYWLKSEPLKWQVAITLLIVTGCRRGEIAGLRVSDLDVKENILKIRNNLLYASDIGIYTDSPKTESSIRSVSIPADSMNLVRELVFENKKNILLLGNKWVDTGYLLTQENGEPMHPRLNN